MERRNAIVNYTQTIAIVGTPLITLGVAVSTQREQRNRESADLMLKFDERLNSGSSAPVMKALEMDVPLDKASAVDDEAIDEFLGNYELLDAAYRLFVLQTGPFVSFRSTQCRRQIVMTHAVGLTIRRSCWWLALLVSVAVVSGPETFATGGSNMSLSADEEAQIRKTVEAIDDEEPAGVLKGDPEAQTRFWAADMTVNAPSNRVVRHDQILGLMKQHTGLQYSSFERHREAIIIRAKCAVTMGYEIVVPKGQVPDSGKTINRRYTNIYYLEDGGWRIIARQATNVSVK